MKDYLLASLTDLQSLDLATVILNSGVAVVLAMFVMLTYWLTYSGTGYSKKFNVSLGMLVLITTMVMCVIGNNVALSLGMVGALSIIRFRTAVKDVRDATFLFWGIAAGICCGVSQYALAAISSVFVFAFLLIFKQFSSDGKTMLIIRCDYAAQNAVTGEVEAYCGTSAHETMRNSTKTGCEIVYLIRTAALVKQNKKLGGTNISELLMRIDGVETVNLVEQTDDIGR